MYKFFSAHDGEEFFFSVELVKGPTPSLPKKGEPSIKKNHHEKCGMGEGSHQKKVGAQTPKK